ncbi:hypothetical protein [Porticoccus sp.]
MRSNRIDLTHRVVHLVRAETDEQALEVLFQIAYDEFLSGTNRAVIGGSRVICFSEAPESEFIKEKYHFRPFGVSVSKKWLFNQNGRPVIYQPKSEHCFIDPSMHWKIVSYSPTEDEWVDWSWQREWRIQADRLELPSDEAVFLVPSEAWKEKLEGLYIQEEEYRAMCESLCLDLYPYPPRDFPYPVQVLENVKE